MSWKWLITSIFLIVPLYYLRKYFQGTQYKKRDRVDNKVFIITGCNTGIGKETALDIASRGGIVYMACRDMKKCEKARKEIVQLTGNTKVYSRNLDLASLDSIRAFVKVFLAEQDRLDVLINNAGVGNIQTRQLTKDGFELQMGTNHLGHFLLTNLLLDLLKISSPSRVVNISSMAYAWANIDKNDLFCENNYHDLRSYCNSKLANNLFTWELAKRLEGTGVVVNCLHPGVCKTDINHRDRFMTYFVEPILYFFMKTSKSGAQTTLSVSLDPMYAKVSGKYFSDCVPKKPKAISEDNELADWLWRTSEKLTGLTFE